jgi:hypothetical protein
VGGLLDEGKETIRDELTRRFPNYFFSTIPASDVRTKPAEPPRSERKGLLDGTGKIRRDLFVPITTLLRRFNDYLGDPTATREDILARSYQVEVPGNGDLGEPYATSGLNVPPQATIRNDAAATQGPISAS